MQCASCAKEIPNGSAFCPHCGAFTGHRRRKTNPARTAAWLIGGAAVLAFFIIIANAPDKPRSEPIEKSEYKLAFIDSNGQISRDDVRVARYRALLDLLEAKAGDPLSDDDGVGSMFVEAQRQLKQRGISESMLNLMEGMNQLIGPGKRDLLSENLAVYVTVRSDLSLSHQQTIDSMRQYGPKNIHLLATGKIRPDGVGGLIVETESGTYHFTAEMLR